jgi:hypothetical protein
MAALEILAPEDACAIASYFGEQRLEPAIRPNMRKEVPLSISVGPVQLPCALRDSVAKLREQVLGPLAAPKDRRASFDDESGVLLDARLVLQFLDEILLESAPRKSAEESFQSEHAQPRESAFI